MAVKPSEMWSRETITFDDIKKAVNQELEKAIFGSGVTMSEKRPQFMPPIGHPPYVSRIDPTCPDLMTVAYNDGTTKTMLSKQVKELGIFPKAVGIMDSKKGHDGQMWMEVKVELFEGQTGEVWVSESFLKEHEWDKAPNLPAVLAKPDVPRWSTAKDPLQELGDFVGAPFQRGSLMTEDQLTATKAKSFNEGFELAQNRAKMDKETWEGMRKKDHDLIVSLRASVNVEAEKAFRSGAAEAKKEMEDYNSQPFSATLAKLKREVLDKKQMPSNYYVQEAVKSIREQGLLMALENGGNKLLQDKLKAHYNEGKQTGLEEGYAEGWEDGESYHKTSEAAMMGAKKEGSMSKDRLMESLRDAYHSHAPQEVILSLLQELEELAFDEGRDQGYEEGLEAQETDNQQEAPIEEQKETKMSTESTTTLEKVLAEGKLAALNIGAKQLVKLVREPMIAFLAGHLSKDDPSMRARVASFLDTDVGEGIMELLISLGLNLLPETMGKENLQGLSSTLRVRAMTNVGDAVADLLMAPVRSVICNVLTPDVVRGALPAEPQRVKVEVPVTVPEPAYQSR